MNTIMNKAMNTSMNQTMNTRMNQETGGYNMDVLDPEVIRISSVLGKGETLAGLVYITSVFV